MSNYEARIARSQMDVYRGPRGEYHIRRYSEDGQFLSERVTNLRHQAVECGGESRIAEADRRFRKAQALNSLRDGLAELEVKGSDQWTPAERSEYLRLADALHTAEGLAA